MSLEFISLGDICNIKHGYGFKGEYFTEEVKKNILLTPGNFKIGGGFKSEKFKYYDGPINKEFILNPQDIIISLTDLSKKGDTLGYSALVPNDEHLYLHNQRIGLVTDINEDKIDKIFLYWLLRSPEYQHYVVSSATGTTVRHTSPKNLLKYEFQLFSLKEQKIIGTILNSIENKIQNNIKINHNLEQIINTHFKNCFLSFSFFDKKFKKHIPDDWNFYNLSEFVLKANTGADAIKKAPIVNYDTGIKCIRTGDLSNNRQIEDWGYVNITNETFERFQLRKGDMVFARTGTASLGLNKLIIADLDAVYNNGIIRLKIDYSKIAPLFLNYYLKSYLYDNYINAIYDETSTRPNMKINYLLKFNLLCPPYNIQKRFDNSIKNMFLLKEQLNDEKKVLTRLRDTLLPKLMSGEIDVSKANHD